MGRRSPRLARNSRSRLQQPDQVVTDGDSAYVSNSKYLDRKMGGQVKLTEHRAVRHDRNTRVGLQESETTMLGWIRKLIGAPASRPPAAAVGDAARSVSFTGDEFYGANSDILDGVQFSATLQARTPLRILEHHGEVFRGPPSQAPDYGGQEHGIWLPKTKGELGDFLQQGAKHASDAGPVAPADYLPFLKAFRAIVEGPGDVMEKIRLLRLLPKESPVFKRFWSKLTSYYPDFPESFFYRRLTELEGVGPTTAKRLFESGIRSIEDVHAATDADLLAVQGVGKALVAKIRSADQSGSARERQEGAPP